MSFYFARHGESEANVEKIISNRGQQHGLTAVGVAQAHELANVLETASVKHIFSSPLLRAVETADILASHYHLEYEISDALREFDCGTLEGKSDSDSWDTLHSIWDDWILNRNWTRQFEQGDSYETIKGRFLPFFNSLVDRFSHKDEAVVLVGHGGTFRAMMPLIVDNLDFEFIHQHWIPNARYVRTEFKDGSLFGTQWGDILLSR